MKTTMETLLRLERDAQSVASSKLVPPPSPSTPPPLSPGRTDHIFEPSVWRAGLFPKLLFGCLKKVGLFAKKNA